MRSIASASADIENLVWIFPPFLHFVDEKEQSAIFIVEFLDMDFLFVDECNLGISFIMFNGLLMIQDNLFQPCNLLFQVIDKWVFIELWGGFTVAPFPHSANLYIFETP